MNISVGKKDLKKWIVLVLIVPIIISFVMIMQWEEKNFIIMGMVLAIIWVITLLIIISLIKEAKNNPYPFTYLVTYDILLKYMELEEKFAFDNNLEASFHYYLYQNNKTDEIQSWHHSSSNIESEKAKGNVFYFNEEEYSSYEILLNKIEKKDIICIELIDSDSTFLNEFKKNHPEFDVVKYIESIKQ